MGRRVFVSGSTGYLGTNVIPILLNRGHEVFALARPGSEGKIPQGCRVISGNALDAASFQHTIAPADTYLHLIGVAHPSPSKAELFRSIDLNALRASVSAAIASGIQHFIYLSVAHPASVMRAYVESRIEAEEIIHGAGLNATFLQPWYVLGPGHRWAYALIPFYWLFSAIPSTRASAKRLGLVTLKQMLSAMVLAVENPVSGIKAVDVPQIKESRL